MSNQNRPPSAAGGPTETTPGRIDLPGGWYLIRDDEAGSRHEGQWFLSEPTGIWVAQFWDGPQAGEDDCRAFARALGVLADG